MDLEQFNSIEEVFNRVMQAFRIEAKELSTLSGVSENHISDFRNGKLKRGISTGLLWDLLDGMEQINPESRRYFCRLLTTKNTNLGRTKLENSDFNETVAQIIDVASQEQIDLILLMISAKLRQKIKANVSTSTYRANGLLGIS